MKISHLSIATNHAKVSAQLVQYQVGSGKGQTSSGNNAAQAKFTSSLVSSECDYTKQDALIKQWNKAGAFNLYDVLNGGKANLQNPNPTSEELQALERELQANGIQGGIDWEDFSFDLRGIGFSTENPTWRLSGDDFRTKTDYLASRYAAMKNKIQTSFSGQEQISQLEKLDSIYQSTIDEIAKGYSEIVGSFFEQNGVSGEQNNIYRAVLDGVKDKAEKYHQYLTANSNFSNLIGSKDAWLLQDDEYVASLLRGVDVEVEAHQTEGDGYTLADLDIMGQYVSELTAWEHPNAINTMSEERIGLDFAMLSIKTSVLSESGTIGSTLRNSLQKMVQGFMYSFLDRMDENLANMRHANAAPGDQVGYASLDRQAIWDVYEQTMEEYVKSGNIKDALLVGSRYGAGRFAEKDTNGSYRHLNSQLYWANFFEKTVGSDFNQNAYGLCETMYQKYAAGIDDFTLSVAEGTGVRLNLVQKSLISYVSSEHKSEINVNA